MDSTHSPIDRINALAEQSKARQQQSVAGQKTKLAAIESIAPGIKAEIAAIATGLADACRAMYGNAPERAAYVRIEAGSEVLELQRRAVPAVYANSPRRQADIAAGLGSKNWRNAQ